MSKKNCCHLDINVASPSKKEININHLNDYCLKGVFNYLNVLEKLEASFVCRRWAGFLAKNLNIDSGLLNEVKKKTKGIPFLLDFIKTFGSFVISLTIGVADLSENTLLLKEIAKNCKNLLRISFQYVSHFNEDDIESIFASNFSISYVTLSGMIMSGKGLLKLQSFITKELKISNCKFTSINYLHSFLSGLKNLEKLELGINYFKSMESILKPMYLFSALNESNCESITEFCAKLEKYEKDEIIELSKLLSKQKKLRILKTDVKVDEKFLECLPKNYLEVLELSSIENSIKYRFSCFENIKLLKLSELAINDEFVKDLIRCTDLKKLKLKISNYSLTETAESSFGQLKNLEYFGVRGKQINVDNVLKALSQCKDLKILSISGCSFTEIGFQRLCLLTELVNLDISYTKLENEQLKKLLKDLVNLETLDISFCEDISEELYSEIYGKIFSKEDNDLISKNLKMVLFSKIK